MSVGADEEAFGLKLDVGEAMRTERLGARQACKARLGEARWIKDSILRARAELEAEKRYEVDLRRIERANRQRRKPPREWVESA